MNGLREIDAKSLLKQCSAVSRSMLTQSCSCDHRSRNWRAQRGVVPPHFTDFLKCPFAVSGAVSACEGAKECMCPPPIVKCFHGKLSFTVSGMATAVWGNCYPSPLLPRQYSGCS